MNKIVRKTLEHIEKIKRSIPKEKELTEVIDRIEKAINLELTDDKINHLLDYYDTINVLLFLGCELSNYEAGFIFDKIMKYNCRVNIGDNNTIIRYEAFEEKGIAKEKIDKLLIDHYYNDNNLTDEEKKLVTKIIAEEEKRMQYIKKAYNTVGEFIQKQSHTLEEYAKLESSLRTLSVPDSLIIAYMSYYEDKEKKVVTSTTPVFEKMYHEDTSVKPPRKQLKEQLNNLYNPKAQEPYFDLKNIKEVLNLLKLLCIADSRVAIILSDIYKYAIKNEEYYNYLVSKAKYMHKYMKQVQDIKDYKELLKDCDDNTKLEIQEILKELYESIEPILTSSFGYEQELSRKILTK